MWSKSFFDEPACAVIADDGNVIAIANYGWADEGASKSVSFYNKNGDLIKEIIFGSEEPGAEPLKWVTQIAISPDGSYCMIGENGEKSALFTLYECAKGSFVWEKRCGFEEAGEIKISESGRNILASTHSYNTQDMLFLLLDMNGKILWQKKIKKNYSWDINPYILANKKLKFFLIA